MTYAEQEADLIATIKRNNAAMADGIVAIRWARDRLDTLEDALRDIQKLAEKNYDGPEDKTNSRILSICREMIGE